MAVQVERAAEAYQRGRHEECLGLLQQGVNTKDTDVCTNSHCTPRYKCCSGSLSFPPAESSLEGFSREQWIVESNCLACKTQVEKQLHTCPSLTICTPPSLTPHTPQMALVAGDVGQLHQIHSQYRSLWERVRGT